jgi:hypothetical protein
MKIIELAKRTLEVAVVIKFLKPSKHFLIAAGHQLKDLM